jgi:hypothetical protein
MKANKLDNEPEVEPSEALGWNSQRPFSDV